jgi:hypothetical protein
MPFVSGALVLSVTSQNVGTSDSLVVGFAIARTATSTEDVLVFYDDTSEMLAIEVRSDGKLHAMVGGSTFLSSDSAMVNNGTWWYWEVKVLLKDSGGSVAFQLNGVGAGSDTGDTLNAGSACDKISFKGIGTGGKLDDIYMGDTSGSFDFLGDVTIETQYPNAVNAKQFTGTPETTNTHENVDDTTPDDDTSYNYSSTSTHQDSFDFPAWSMTASDTIHGVGVNCVASKHEAGSADLKLVCWSSSTEDLTAAIGLGVGYTSEYAMWYENPDTSTAWTKATLEAAKFGYELV